MNGGETDPVPGTMMGTHSWWFLGKGASSPAFPAHPHALSLPRPVRRQPPMR